MSKKEIIKALIHAYGLNPEVVVKYDLKAQNSKKSTKAWKIVGTDKNNDVAMSISDMVGFKETITEIISQAKNVVLHVEE